MKEYGEEEAKEASTIVSRNTKWRYWRLASPWRDPLGTVSIETPKRFSRETFFEL